ncbi:MAG: endonuclease [Fibrobacteraceae bacterium]|nr:endonuclease [Fibrobacteraceae bacterium]
MKQKILFICCGVVLLSYGLLFAEKPRHRNYRGASQVLAQVYTGDLAKDLYCGCPYSGKQNIDTVPCGFRPRENPRRKSYKRARRIEWEHIVTAHNMGHFRPCWRDGGRKNCSYNDPTFEMMEGDLHNLYPAIGEINGDRSNFMYSQWTNSPEPMYGSCETVVDFKLKKVQPRKEIQGLIARVHFYMENQYAIKLSNQDRKLFEAWDKMYPVTKEECERDRRIEKKQGNRNPFVEKACKELGL